MKLLAIIPARAGSKGLKDKNIRPLGGIPLCAWTIRAAKQSGVFDEIHFSTDSEQYAQIAREYGASVPFLRSAELASDTAGLWEVVKAVIGKYREAGRGFDAVMLLQPTTPFRSAEDIRAAVRLLEEKNAQAIVSVKEDAHPAAWSAELPPDGDMRIFHEKLKNGVRRQEFRTSYALNGALYLVRIGHLFETETIFQRGCYAYVMPEERSADIDDQLDFEWCEFLCSRRS